MVKNRLKGSCAQEGPFLREPQCLVGRRNTGGPSVRVGPGGGGQRTSKDSRVAVKEQGVTLTD